MRASRLLAILLLLESRGLVTATELSETLEVSLRTVYRDLEQLGVAGVPIYAERGRDGGYRLVDGWQSHLTGLTLDEAQALFLTGLDTAATGLGLSDATDRARRKLAAALAPLGDVDRVASRFHLDPTAWYDRDERPTHLATITEALWTDRRLHVGYASWRRTADRTLEPLGIVLKAGRWYLVAKTPPGNGNTNPRDVRTYRCSEIKTCVVGKKFHRPDAFNLPAWWRERSAEFEASLRTRRATLRASPLGIRQLHQYRMLDPDQPRNHPPSHWTTITIPIESDERAAHDLARLGAEVEVLRPQSLRRVMRQLAAHLTTIYAKP